MHISDTNFFSSFTRHTLHDLFLLPCFCFTCAVVCRFFKIPSKWLFIQNDLSDSGCANLNGDWLMGWIIYKQGNECFYFAWKMPRREWDENAANIMNGATNWTGIKDRIDVVLLWMAYALEKNETCNIRKKRPHHNKILDW